MKLTASQKRALDVTDEEWRVLYEALGQYMENQADHAPLSDDPADLRKAEIARVVLERFDAVFCELADLSMHSERKLES